MKTLLGFASVLIFAACSTQSPKGGAFVQPNDRSPSSVKLAKEIAAFKGSENYEDNIYAYRVGMSLFISDANNQAMTGQQKKKLLKTRILFAKAAVESQCGSFGGCGGLRQPATDAIAQVEQQVDAGNYGNAANIVNYWLNRF